MINPYKIFIQARMSSSRFPGKILAPFNNAPMIKSTIDRCKNVNIHIGKTISGVDIEKSENISIYPLKPYKLCLVDCYDSVVDIHIDKELGNNFHYPFEILDQSSIISVKYI